MLVVETIRENISAGRIRSAEEADQGDLPGELGLVGGGTTRKSRSEGAAGSEGDRVPRYARSGSPLPEIGPVA